MSDKKLVNINSNEFEMIVEESQSFFSKGLDIVVFLNKKTKRKLYAKAVKMAKEGIILQPLTATEMKEFKIEESLSETSYNSDGTFDLDIQESIDETSAVQPIAKFNSKDPESMRKAAKIATQIADKLEGKDAEKESLETENEDLRSKLDLIATQKFMEKKRSLGAPDDITSPEELMGYEKAIKSKTPTSQSVPSGSVPLSSQTLAKSEGWGTVKEMIDAVNSDPDKSVRNALLSKVLKGSRNSQVNLEFLEKVDPNTVMSSDLGEGLLLSKRPDPYNLKHAFREKKLRERASMGDQQAQNILASGDF